jgi:peptidoglycan/xylan/chitin deacetylase (PgdA/CDA1 family)
MADDPRIISRGIINNESLKHAYDYLLSVLGKYSINATAAFVSAFAVDSSVLYDHVELIKRLAKLNPTWFTSILAILNAGEFDGWSGSAFYRLTSAAGMEIGWHGASHLPLSEQTSEQSAAIEIELASRLSASLGQQPRTIVFPRNQIGHLPLLRTVGFENYRDGLANDGIDKVRNLLAEFNLTAGCKPQALKVENGWGVCSAGNFLNWPSGIRRLVPLAVTINRWKSMLRAAAEQGGHVHMWFHPHNFITAPQMKISFEEITRFAGDLVRHNDLINLTIGEHAALARESQ